MYIWFAIVHIAKSSRESFRTQSWFHAMLGWVYGMTTSAQIPTWSLAYKVLSPFLHSSPTS